MILDSRNIIARVFPLLWNGSAAHRSLLEEYKLDISTRGFYKMRAGSYTPKVIDRHFIQEPIHFDIYLMAPKHTSKQERHQPSKGTEVDIYYCYNLSITHGYRLNPEY